MRENAWIFNKAAWHYAVGQLSEVVDLLNRVEYTDIRYNLGAKALLVRTWFDLGEEEALLSLIDSFRQYLHRNQLINDYRAQGFRNLLRLTRRALLIKSEMPFQEKNATQRDLNRLEKSIQEEANVINKKWLQAKLQLLRESVKGG